MKVALGILAPVIVFGFWGLVDFRNAGRISEPLHLAHELVISALAVVALYAAGQPALGWALVVISIAHHGLVYALGETLLKQQKNLRIDGCIIRVMAPGRTHEGAELQLLTPRILYNRSRYVDADERGLRGWKTDLSAQSAKIHVPFVPSRSKHSSCRFEDRFAEYLPRFMR